MTMDEMMLFTAVMLFAILVGTAWLFPRDAPRRSRDTPPKLRPSLPSRSQLLGV